MADTMFNIFGDHLSNPKHRQILRVNKTDENYASVGKPGLPTVLTPANKSKHALTPRDFKKKSFLQNMGTPIQGGYRRSALQPTTKTFLQIYEDKAQPRSVISHEDMIQVEYTRKPGIDDDDGELSDSDLVVADKLLNNLVMNLPEATPPYQKPSRQFDMSHPILHLDLDDVLSDDMFSNPGDDMDIMSDIDIPTPFDF